MEKNKGNSSSSERNKVYRQKPASGKAADSGKDAEQLPVTVFEDDFDGYSNKAKRNSAKPSPGKADEALGKKTHKKSQPVDDYEDLSSYSKSSKSVWDRKVVPFFNKNNKRNTKIILSTFFSALGVVLVVLIAVYGSTFYSLINSFLHGIVYDADGGGYDSRNKDVTFANEEDETENLHYSNMYEINSASLNDMLRNWAKNGGEKLHSKNVINCLLIGADKNDGGSRSDTIMIASVNLKTDEITLTSIMRDSYTYLEIDGEGRYAKINACFNWGGPAALIDTIENDLKIEIDNYVIVDFSTFPKLIDAMGGIEVKISEKEAKFINRTTRYTVSSGDAVTLNGDEALVFARIRKLDTDEERTRRQRLVIMSIIKKVKSASLTELDDAVATVCSYVRTNYTKKELLSLGTRALSEGWADYKITQYASPLIESKDVDSDEATGRSAYIKIPRFYSGNQFVWIVDYPVEAQRVQQAIYGTTNIVLNTDREAAFDYIYEKDTTTSYYTTSYSTTESQSTSSYDTTTTESTTSFWPFTTSSPTENYDGEESTTVPDDNTTTRNFGFEDATTTQPTTESTTQTTTRRSLLNW